jgi:hypothetical protein
MFTVFFKKSAYNPYKSYAQNANRRVGSRSFKTYAQAYEFSKTVDTMHIINPMGQLLSF